MGQRKRHVEIVFRDNFMEKETIVALIYDPAGWAENIKDFLNRESQSTKFGEFYTRAQVKSKKVKQTGGGVY